MRTTLNRKNNEGEYIKTTLISTDDIKTEIEALIETAKSDLEMIKLAEKRRRIPQNVRECGIYVQALEDLATRLGVDVK